jgi:hypothetical protein
MKAYGNHFQVEDKGSTMLVTYDSCVKFVFQQSKGIGDVCLERSNMNWSLEVDFEINLHPMSSPIL